MKFDIDLYHHYPDGDLPPSFILALRSLETSLMSLIGDKLDSLEASLDAAISRVAGDITALQAHISDLQAKVDAGLATPEDVARLDAFKAKLDMLDAATAPPAPTPDVPPAV